MVKLWWSLIGPWGKCWSLIRLWGTWWSVIGSWGKNWSYWLVFGQNGDHWLVLGGNGDQFSWTEDVYVFVAVQCSHTLFVSSVHCESRTVVFWVWSFINNKHYSEHAHAVNLMCAVQIFPCLMVMDLTPLCVERDWLTWFLLLYESHWLFCTQRCLIEHQHKNTTAVSAVSSLLFHQLQ